MSWDPPHQWHSRGAPVWADIIDGRAFDIERQRFPTVQRFVHTGVGGIAGGIYGAGQQHGIPRVQRGKLLPCKRRC